MRAIIAKLKSSPARRDDPARLARVTALETALTDYVERGTPPGDVPAAMQPEAPDTAAVPVAAGPAERAEADGSEGAELVPHAPAAGLSLLDRLTAPLALILSILGLVLYGLLRLALGQWHRQQRRETLTASHARHRCPHRRRSGQRRRHRCPGPPTRRADPGPYLCCCRTIAGAAQPGPAAWRWSAS